MMALKFMYITNDEKIAKIAENNGVEWIFVDLEINGKDERQGHLDTIISRHNLHDVRRIKRVLTNSELLVRVNPIYEGSEVEIRNVINAGADVIMLPFFKTSEEVQTFIGHVGYRAKTCLLLETAEGVENIDSILDIRGIDYIHIGLNDLHLSYGMKFMFELLADGTVEFLCNKIRKKGIPYGFGGIARIGGKALPAEYIIAEHYRLGSSMVILSRSFCNSAIDIPIASVMEIFNTGVKEIRDFETLLMSKPNSYFINNKRSIDEKVSTIVSGISETV